MYPIPYANLSSIDTVPDREIGNLFSSCLEKISLSVLKAVRVRTEEQLCSSDYQGKMLLCFALGFLKLW